MNNKPTYTDQCKEWDEKFDEHIEPTPTESEIAEMAEVQTALFSEAIINGIFGFKMSPTGPIVEKPTGSYLRSINQ